MLVSAQALLTSASHPPSDPWSDAVAEAQALLHAHPGFEESLRSYSALAQQLEAYLASLDRASAALEIVDQLKSTNLPLLGNAWQALRQALDLAAPGAGAALGTLDEGLRQLQRLRGVLDDLPTVERTAEAVRAFRQSPSRETLVALAETCPASIRALEALQREIAQPLRQLDELVADIETAQHALREIGGLMALGDAVAQIEGAVAMAAGPVYELRDGLSMLQRQIESDVSVLRQFEQIVARAGHPVSGATGGGGGLGLLVIQLAAAGAAAGAYWLSRRGKAVASAPSTAAPPPSPPSLGMPLPRAPVEAVQPVAWLTAESGPLAGQRLPLTRPRLLLGRGSEADIRLLDPTVSRTHAQLRQAQGAWFIQDLGSTGGTFVNTQRILATRLRPGDRITIGSTTFLFGE